MTPARRRALDRLTRQARALSPELVAAILGALRLLRDRVPVAEVERLIRAGRIADVVNVAAPAELIERALNPATRVLSDGVVRSMRGTVPLLPAKAQEISALFNTLNPNVLRAIQTLDTETLRSLIPEIRETVRAAVEAGIREGVSPRTVARGLRETIGLAPNQQEAVANFRRALESGDFAKARGYQLRDRRFDGVLKRGDALSEAQIDRMTARYQERFIARNAETHARTAALDAHKVGQQLAWEEAKASGALGDAEVEVVWVTNIDGRERPEHNAMNGATRPLDGAYSTGQRYPGEGEWGCRCSEIMRVKRPSFALAA